MAAGTAILLVEDNAFDAKVFRYALRDAGVDIPVTVMRDGVEALDFLENHSADKTSHLIIVTDLKMPRMSGIDLLRKLRGTASLAHLPVFVMTTSDLPTDYKDALDLGIESYIRKTGDEQDLVSPIVSYLTRQDGRTP